MIPILEGAFGVLLIGATIAQANRQHASTHWWHRWWTWGVGVMALWLVLSVMLSYAPVLRNASAIVTRDGFGMIHLSLVGTKVRDCEWIRTEAYIVDEAGNSHEASLLWEGDRIAGNSRPLGRHKWEPARIEFDRDIQADQIELIATHSCGWMWRATTTTLGPWKIPR